MEGKEGDGSSRLPSFSGPRALTLSAAPSRVTKPSRRSFVPNVAAAAAGKDTVDKANVKQEKDSPKDNTRQPGRRREDGRGGGRGGKRDMRKTELVQSEGIFSEGVGGKTVMDKKFSSAGTSSSSGAASFRSSLSSGKTKEARSKTEIKSGKHSHSKSRSSEALLTEDDEYSPRMVPLSVEQVSTLAHQLQISDSTASIMLLRLPEELPLMQDVEKPQEGEEPQKLVTNIASFPEGLVGSMNIKSDGQATLTIGQTEFTVEAGNHADFFQELLLVNEDNVIPMGTVRHKYICRTNVDSLINPHLL